MDTTNRSTFPPLMRSGDLSYTSLRTSTYAIPPEGWRRNAAICSSVYLSHAPTSKTAQMAMVHVFQQLLPRGEKDAH